MEHKYPFWHPMYTSPDKDIIEIKKKEKKTKHIVKQVISKY